MFISFHFIGRPDDCHVYIYKSPMHRHEANAQDAEEKKKKKKKSRILTIHIYFTCNPL